jgi:hypothetical protein
MFSPRCRHNALFTRHCRHCSEVSHICWRHIELRDLHMHTSNNRPCHASTKYYTCVQIHHINTTRLPPLLNNDNNASACIHSKGRVPLCDFTSLDPGIEWSWANRWRLITWLHPTQDYSWAIAHKVMCACPDTYAFDSLSEKELVTFDYTLICKLDNIIIVWKCPCLRKV